MAKRSRDEASALQPPQDAKHENPTKPPPAKRFREPSIAREATEKARGSMENWRTQPEANKVAGDPLPPHVVTGDAPEAHAGGDGGTVTTTAATLPRWWQLWLGRGGGMVVNCEELLRGWFPFVDEDFASEAENVEWFSIWGDEVVW